MAPDTRTFRNETPYPFCPGCGHGSILDHLDRALQSLRLDPSEVVIVSDIGCSGLSDQYFKTSAFHGLHGRSLTYATGIKLARPELKVIVIMGDGGTGIGGAHLLGAARRNIGVTTIVMNNLNFGMTGGQHSATTPEGSITSTTPGGNLERPLDICATVAANGAGYVHRGSNFDADLPERLADAIRGERFALLDIWDLCTAYYVPSNKASKKTIASLQSKLGMPCGVIQDLDRPEYAAAYREAATAERGKPVLAPRGLVSSFEASLDRRFGLVVAGSAGGKVRSAVRLVAQAGILSGLWSAQRDDYPITIKSGHSISELVLDPAEIHYTGITSPDALVLVTEDGLRKAGRHLAAMGPESRVFAVPEFAGIETPAQVTVCDPAEAATRIKPTNLALFTIAAALGELGILPAGALREAARLGRLAAHVEENLATLEAGLSLAK